MGFLLAVAATAAAAARADEDAWRPTEGGSHSTTTSSAPGAPIIPPVRLSTASGTGSTSRS